MKINWKSLRKTAVENFINFLRHFSTFFCTWTMKVLDYTLLYIDDKGIAVDTTVRYTVLDHDRIAYSTASK